MERRKLKERVMSLLFPHKCFLCGRVLEGASWLCECCTLPLVALDELCICCGKRWRSCVCKTLRPAFRRAFAPLFYTDEVRRGIHRFKYRGAIYYADFLGGLMADRLGEATQDGFDRIAYVPMHPSKLRERGAYPARALALVLSERLAIPTVECLLHTKNQRVQAGQKGLAARLQNAQESFVKMPNAPRMDGMRVLLVDDVLTTGATAHVCATLLCDYGATEVWVVAAASVE